MRAPKSEQGRLLFERPDVSHRLPPEKREPCRKLLAQLLWEVVAAESERGRGENE